MNLTPRTARSSSGCDRRVRLVVVAAAIRGPLGSTGVGEARDLAAGVGVGVRQGASRARGDLRDTAGSGSARRSARSASSTPRGSGTSPGRRTATVYAATGDEGKVFRREAKDDAAWTVAYDAQRHAGPVPGRPARRPRVRRHRPERPGRRRDRPASTRATPRLDPDVQYIWDLAADAEGNLYAATGPTGQLWKRSADGKWSLLLDSKHAHLLCVAVGPDGAVYAGSDGEGLIYRVAADGKASVVYDAPQNEVRSLLFAPDGTLYAGTAAESGGGGGLGPRLGRSSRRVGEPDRRPAAPSAVGRRREPPQPTPSDRPKSPPPASPSPPAGGSARAPAGLAGRQRRLPDRPRRRPPRGLPGQGA